MGHGIQWSSRPGASSLPGRKHAFSAVSWLGANTQSSNLATRLVAKPSESFAETSPISLDIPLEGFEPPTNGLGNRCSVLLSYRGIAAWRQLGHDYSTRKKQGQIACPFGTITVPNLSYGGLTGSNCLCYNRRQNTKPTPGTEKIQCPLYQQTESKSTLVSCWVNR